MLDLETLGQAPGSVIVAIGAVKFGDGATHAEFYQRVDPQSCVNLGMKIDAPTVLWWLGQPDAARQEIIKSGSNLTDALMAFADWVGDADAEVWGNGAGFDNVLLADAYDRAHFVRPWKFWNDRCYRTVKGMYPHVAMDRRGTHHNALDDAKSQAMHLLRMWPV
jgi:hypothetical protein